jgi:hypothetical protein
VSKIDTLPRRDQANDCGSGSRRLVRGHGNFYLPPLLAVSSPMKAAILAGTAMPTALPMDSLGAHENAGVVSFGIWLPWVSAGDGFRLALRIIHERDQYLQAVAATEFAMTHEQRAPHGDYWSASVPIAGASPPGSHWGTPGRYLYRYCVWV